MNSSCRQRPHSASVTFVRSTLDAAPPENAQRIGHICEIDTWRGITIELLRSPEQLQPTTRTALGEGAVSSVQSPDLVSGERSVAATLDGAEASRRTAGQVVNRGNPRSEALRTDWASGASHKGAGDVSIAMDLVPMGL